MKLIFDDLELTTENFSLKFTGSIVEAFTDELQKKPRVIYVDSVARDYYKIIDSATPDECEIRTYFKLHRQIPESLGYLNTKRSNEATYGALHGHRQQKQGLTIDRFSWKGVKPYSPLELFQYFTKDYLTLEEATMNFMLGTKVSIALSSNFCIFNNGFIYFRNIPIGNYVDGIDIKDDELLELWNNEVK